MQCIYQIVIIAITIIIIIIIIIMCITALPETLHRQRVGVWNAIAEGPRHSEIKWFALRHAGGQWQSWEMSSAFLRPNLASLKQV